MHLGRIPGGEILALRGYIDKWDTRSRIAPIGNPLVSTWQVKCPVYIVHGTNDEVISYSHAEDLVRNCQEGIAYPPYMVQNGGHNNLEVVSLLGKHGRDLLARAS